MENRPRKASADKTSRRPADDDWWRAFFENPDSLRLAFFPEQWVTDRQVDGLARLLAPWRPRCILDLCCGAGRHMAPLLRRGYPVVGLDASSMMVARARSAVGGVGRVVRGEAQRLPLASGAFDVVLCLFNSFGYLPTDEANQQVLREAARCLRPGGRLLLDTRNRAYQLSQLPFSEIVALQGGGAIWLECRHDPVRDRLVSEFRCAGTGRVLHRASIRCYSLAELEAMLTRCGLRLDDTFGGYDWTPLRADSREVLILAVRDGGA
ncbi:MAG: class I SAM-dependent methyltransferase [Armatimonadetes bacterium]|nr:class I SAM-dependent methyltransferase [Armatimonadota bacterium]